MIRVMEVGSIRAMIQAATQLLLLLEDDSSLMRKEAASYTKVVLPLSVTVVEVRVQAVAVFPQTTGIQHYLVVEEEEEENQPHHHHCYYLLCSYMSSLWDQRRVVEEVAEGVEAEEYENPPHDAEIPEEAENSQLLRSWWCWRWNLHYYSQKWWRTAFLLLLMPTYMRVGNRDAVGVVTAEVEEGDTSLTTKRRRRCRSYECAMCNVQCACIELCMCTTTSESAITRRGTTTRSPHDRIKQGRKSGE
jgi:hypothetical protein